MLLSLIRMLDVGLVQYEVGLTTMEAPQGKVSDVGPIQNVLMGIYGSFVDPIKFYF